MQTRIVRLSIVAAFGFLGAALAGCQPSTAQNSACPSTSPPSNPSPEAAFVPVEQLRYQNVTGLLGKPLGSKTIVDAVFENPTMIDPGLHISKVDGRSLASIVYIEPLGKDLKQGIHYKLEGYETGAFEGNPDWCSRGEQESFHYEAKFVLTRIIEPVE
jgi:hypothetical protein